MFLSILTYVMIVVEALCSFLLITVILMQKSKSQGVGMAFGGGMGESLFGAQMGNVLSKTTMILAIIFLVNTTGLAVIGSRHGAPSVTDRIVAKPAPVQPAANPIPSGIPPSAIPDQQSVPIPETPEVAIPETGDVKPIVIGDDTSSEPISNDQPKPVQKDPAMPADQE